MIPVQTKKKGKRPTLRLLDIERREQIKHAREMVAKEAKQQETSKTVLPGHWLLSAAGVIDKAVAMTPELDAESIDYLRAAAERCRAIGRSLKDAAALALLFS